MDVIFICQNTNFYDTELFILTDQCNNRSMTDSEFFAEENLCSLNIALTILGNEQNGNCLKNWNCVLILSVKAS